MLRRLALLLLSANCGGTLYGASTPDELASELTAALDAHDRPAFEACFNFNGTDLALQQSFFKLEDTVFSWPSHYVLASERAGKGKMSIMKEGKEYTLNGDCTFDISIHVAQSPSRGFVLPAGFVNGRYQVLRLIAETP